MDIPLWRENLTPSVPVLLDFEDNLRGYGILCPTRELTLVPA